MAAGCEECRGSCVKALIERRHSDIVSGGTDNHLMLSRSYLKHDLTVEKKLEKRSGCCTYHMLIRIQCTKRSSLSIRYISGVRLGTPAVTTRGLLEEDMKVIAKAIRLTLLDKKLDEANELVLGLTEKYPLYE